MVRRLVQNVLLKRRSLLLGLVAIATVACSAMPADACRLLDWLFPRRTAQRQCYYAIPGSPAVNTNYSPYRTTNYGNPGPSARSYAWYAPQTQYRSLWAQVPVTTYRPVGTNGLQPCTSYAWQTQRVPVTSYQPTLGATTAPAASSCRCDSGATRAYYGSTPAYSQWQTVAPSTGNLYGYRSASEFAPVGRSTTGQVVTSGYAPNIGAPNIGTGTTAVDYAGATPWTPVQNTYAQTGGASPWQSNDGSYDGDQRSSQTQAGATPWRPVDSNAAPTPADKSPTLNRPNYDAGRSRSELDDADRSGSELDDSKIDRDSARPDSQRPEVDDGWQRYNEMRDLDSGSSTTRTGSFRQNVRRSNERLVPFQRPIPDPDRNHNWDFDDKFQRGQDRPLRSARRSDSRWEAIPVRATFSPQPPRDETVRRSDRYQDNRPADDLLPPAQPRRPQNEGGWRSLAR